MIKSRLMQILLFFVLSVFNLGQQPSLPAQTDFAEDMKRLVELNSVTENLIDLSVKEAVNIYENADTDQIIEITAPYLDSKILNARELSRLLLLNAYKKAKKISQSQQVVEILCRHYLSDEETQLSDNFLPGLREKDFNDNAKKEIEKFLHSRSKHNYANNAKWLSYAQIKQSIPILWSYVKKDKKDLQKRDLIVLSSLARLGEKEAGVMICNYYKSTINTTNYEYVLTAKRIAFSLDETVLKCLVDDYKTMDIGWDYRDGDTGFTPSQVVGGAITQMIKNYPYQKGEYNINPKQLLDWLNQTNHYELNEK